MPELEPARRTYAFEVPKQQEKLQDLIAYIAIKCESDPLFGMTKLAKILFFSDFLHYAKYGKPITGVTYHKYPQGPLPKDMYETIRSSQNLEEVARKRFNYDQKRVVARQEPDLSLFTATEIATVDMVIDELALLDARGVSELSHSIAWEVVADQEPMPYESAFFSHECPSRQDVAQAEELLRAGLLDP